MTDAIQRKAAEAIATQAERTAARGKADLPLPQGESWVMSSGMMPRPIHTGRLREAEQLYAQAVSVYPQGFWMYQRALLLMELGDFDEAIGSFEACAAQGDYLSLAELQPVLWQCRLLQQGQGPKSEDDTLDWFKQQMMQRMAQFSPSLSAEMEQAFAMAARLGAADGDEASCDAQDNAARRAPLSEAQSRRICELAEDFAWALVDGDYARAYAMLMPELQDETTINDLQKDYEAMVSYAETPINRVHALPPHNDLPDMPATMLAWVMVSIDSDDIAEAITLDICQLDDDTLRIGALEWGRP